MTFGQRLQLLLEERNLSQKKLSLDLNMAASTLGNYVRDLREPDYRTLKQIAEYFNVSIDYLLSFSLGKETKGNNDNEIEFLRIFRSLDNEQQEIYIQQGKAFVQSNQKKINHSKIK